MFHGSVLRRASLAALAGVMALGAAPGLGWAQPAPPPEPPPPGYDSRYDYDACQKQKTDRGVAGAVIGGVLGGLLGSGIAAGGHRTTGTIVGAGAGAVGGAVVGSSSADCNNPPPPPPPPPPPEAYEDRSYGGDQDHSYSDGGGDRYSGDEDRYQRDDDRSQGDDRAGDQANRQAQEDAGPPPGNGDCTTASSPIYMPDGRVQQSQVRVCRDASGRYQVVE